MSRWRAITLKLRSAVQTAHERRGISVTTPDDADKVLVTRQLQEYEKSLQLLEAQYSLIRHEPMAVSEPRQKD